MKVTMGPFPEGFGEQEIDVHIDPWDTWGMDTTLAHIILPMLKQLRATKQGAPCVDYEDVPEELRPTEEEIAEYNTNGKTDDNFFKRWDWCMDEMIFAFNSKLEDWEYQFEKGHMDLLYEPLDKDHNPIGEPMDIFERDKDIPGVEFYKMVHGPKHTYEVDWDARRVYQDRISNGFKLFGKYFENLWD